ncbi:MAG TPA: hypothetical protein VF498_09615, partial [Anaerolineales bacterium]
TMVKVIVQEKVDEQIAETRDNAPMQVWRLQIELTGPWPMQKEPQTVFSALALVIQEQGEWKFERFLTDGEIMANTSIRQNYPQNPALLGNGVTGEDMTNLQE